MTGKGDEPSTTDGLQYPMVDLFTGGTMLPQALRKQMQKQRSRRPDSPITQAVWLWATQKPITQAQATLVAQRLGTSIEDITRDREIVSE
jgi:hypothetical protein